MKVFNVVDLGFGDSGKGTIVDYLTRSEDISLIVRYNGGAQCGHNVVDPDGRHFCFHQFGSGTMVPGVRTYLSNFVLFNPLALFQEEKDLQAVGITDGYSRMFVDKHALVTTPYHILINRLSELSRGDFKHGSCGMGIGETVNQNIHHPELSICVADLTHSKKLTKKLMKLRIYATHKMEALTPVISERYKGIAKRLCDQLLSDKELEDTSFVYTQIAERITITGKKFLSKEVGNIVFEGAQGVLLDETYGFAPFNTWTNTTRDNADTLIMASGLPKATTYGVIRAFATRHGAGPFPTEDEKLMAHFQDSNNPYNNWQETFRVGKLDLNLIRYALTHCKVDGLAVTCLDSFMSISTRQVCNEYTAPGVFNSTGLEQAVPIYRDLSDLSQTGYLSYIAYQLGVPVVITSNGPTWANKQEVKTC
jgi:adenylosuccinate synthase